MLASRFNSFLLVSVIVLLLSACNNTGIRTADRNGGYSNLNPEQALYPPVAASGLPTNPDADLWKVMANAFQFPNINNARVQKEINWYTRHPQYMARISKRSQPYLYFIIKEIEKRGLPMELALLPVVESAFNPTAHSHAKASGLWQFIPSTGRMFGLKQNWWYDGRRDIVSSTRAALDFLEQLNKSFDGDWHLALAAYNTGGANVRRAIKRNRTKGKSEDYWSLPLARETKAYIPKLLAIAYIVKHQEDFNLNLSPVYNQPYFQTLRVKQQIDLSVVSKLAQIPESDIIKLNPGFKRFATPPNKSAFINIPISKAKHFYQKLAKLNTRHYLKSKKYKIRKGDSLGSIAQRFNVSKHALRQINKIKGNRIKRGKILHIPTANDTLTSRSKSYKGKRNKLIHIVKNGDTLWDLANTYKVNYKKLATWNRITTRTTLKLGQKLIVWVNQQRVARVDSIPHKG